MEDDPGFTLEEATELLHELRRAHLATGVEIPTVVVHAEEPGASLSEEGVTTGVIRWYLVVSTEHGAGLAALSFPGETL